MVPSRSCSMAQRLLGIMKRVWSHVEGSPSLPHRITCMWYTRPDGGSWQNVSSWSLLPTMEHKGSLCHYIHDQKFITVVNEVWNIIISQLVRHLKSALALNLLVPPSLRESQDFLRVINIEIKSFWADVSRVKYLTGFETMMLYNQFLWYILWLQIAHRMRE
jgi:hypothetical protein